MDLNQANQIKTELYDQLALDNRIEQLLTRCGLNRNNAGQYTIKLVFSKEQADNPLLAKIPESFKGIEVEKEFS
jgi:hypothetical protein